HAAPGIGGLIGAQSPKDDTQSNAQPATDDRLQRLLSQAEETQQRLTDLKTELAGAPKEISAAQGALSKLKSEDGGDLAERLSKLSVPVLEQRLATRVEELAQWQQALTAANSMLISAQTRPERAQADISRSQLRIDEINGLLKSGRENNKPLTDDRRALLDAEKAALSAQIELRRQELAGNSVLQDLGQNRRDLLTAQIARAEQESIALQTAINNKRREESEQTVAKFSAKAEQAGSDRLLPAESEENRRLSGYLL